MIEKTKFISENKTSFKKYNQAKELLHQCHLISQ